MLVDSYTTTRTLAPGDFIDLAAISPFATRPLPRGRYSVGIVLDPTRQVTEQRETDNVVQRYLKYLYAGPRPSEAEEWLIYR